MEILLIVACMFVGFAIGANDIANAIGTVVGSNVLKYKTAILLASVAFGIGALSGGSNTLDTVGKGVIDTTMVGHDTLAVALMCAAIVVGIATYYRFPVSTTQSLIGSLTGVGLAIGLKLDNSVIFNIALVWTILPLLSLFLAFVFYFIFESLFKRIFIKRIYSYEKFIAILVASSGFFVAFSLGTNNIGNVIGILEVNNVLEKNISIILGAISFTMGSLLFSKRVIFTIGKGITTLDPLRAFVSQFSTAIAVILCTIVGVPVSLSQATVGSVIGVGFTWGSRAVNKRFVLRIIGSWIITPLISGLIMYLVYSFT